VPGFNGALRYHTASFTRAGLAGKYLLSRLLFLIFQNILKLKKGMKIMPELSSVHKKFILHWGEMGTRWGISRTVAQIHALLYISPGPLNAEEITNTLSVARSNVSISLKELQSWGLVKISHVIGDRRDHFETMTDVWEMFRVVMDERKRREVDPTIAMLEECLLEMEETSDTDAHTRERLGSLREFFTTAHDWYEQTSKLSTASYRKLAGMGGMVLRALKLV